LVLAEEHLAQKRRAADRAHRDSRGARGGDLPSLRREAPRRTKSYGREQGNAFRHGVARALLETTVSERQGSRSQRLVLDLRRLGGRGVRGVRRRWRQRQAQQERRAYDPLSTVTGPPVPGSPIPLPPEELRYVGPGDFGRTGRTFLSYFVDL